MFKNSIKKTLSFLAMISVIVACGGKKEATVQEVAKVDETKPGWEQDKDKVTFDWYINYSWYAGKWGEDVVSKEITDKTGVSVNYIIPTGDGTEKLNTMIASGTLPDLITLDARDPIIDTLIKGKLVLPLNQLADEHDKYFYKVVDMDRLNWFKKEDGNTYGYPNASYTSKNYAEIPNIGSNNSFMVRKDIYEAIGKPDMSTREGFTNALKMAKEKFPTVNGQPLSPLGFQENISDSLTWYLQDLLAVPMEKDGKLYDGLTDPEYIAWMKEIRKDYQDGLISTDVFVDKRSQIEEKIAQGRYFAMMYPYIDALQPLTLRYQNDVNSAYIAVDGPKNANKDQHTLGGPGISGWTVTLISKNAKNPAKAIRLFSYLMSEEGQRTITLGKKGESWDVIDGKEQFKPEILKMREENRKEFDQKIGADNMHWMFMDLAMQKKNWALPTPAPVKQLEEWSFGKVQPRFVYEQIQPEKNTPEGIIADKIALKLPKLIASLVTAKSDAEFDEILAKYLDERNKIGFDQLQEYRNKKMNENKVKLGVK